MGHYYIVFAGESIYLKKWSCRGLQRGFIGLYTIIRYDCGGRKWVEHYGEKVVKGGEIIVW